MRKRETNISVRMAKAIFGLETPTTRMQSEGSPSIDFIAARGSHLKSETKKLKYTYKVHMSVFRSEERSHLDEGPTRYQRRTKNTDEGWQYLSDSSYVSTHLHGN